MIFAYLVSALYVLGQLFPTALLFRFRKFGREFERRYGREPRRAEGISVLVPVKGPEPRLRQNLEALLAQDYAGAVELVLAFQDANDPELPVAEALLAAHAATPARSVKILRGLRPLGLNFKNSNLEHAARAASHAWFYCADADTRVGADHLRRALTLAQAEAATGHACFITSISVHEEPREAGAWLEVIGTNMEFANYFLLSHLSPEKGALNGASMFFHKQTLDKIGGFGSFLDKITDDLAMQRAFVNAGARSLLLPSLTRVALARQSLGGFYRRQLRWQLIVRCFDPVTFYALAPLNWVGQWLLLFAALAGSAPLAALGAAVLAVRLTRSLVFQIALGTPARDWAKSFCLPAYDFISPFIWLNTILVSRVEWAGTTLSVGRDGTLRAISAGSSLANPPFEETHAGH